MAPALFSVSLGAILTPKRNLRQCLCKILEWQTKSIMVCYGISGVVNSREFFTFTCFHRLSTRNRIPPPLVFHRPFWTVECSLGYKQYLLFSFRVYKFWVCCEGTNKTRGGLGRVCATGMYRSIEHVKFPKFQTGIFCWMESAPVSSLRILARVISCEFTREAVSEISTSTVSLNNMSFKKFHPFKDFQSVQIQRSSRNIFTAHYACRMPNWIWHLASHGNNY